GMERALDLAPGLLERRGQRAGHDAVPVRVDAGLVLGVDGGDRVLAVHDRRDGGLEDDILDARAVLPANRMHRIDLDVDMEAVVPEQHVREPAVAALAVADERASVLQRAVADGASQPELVPLEIDLHDVVPAQGLAVVDLLERHDLVEDLVSAADHEIASSRIVRRALLDARAL